VMVMATEISLEKELFRFGLSQSEIKVYEFLLRNGESEISEVSRKLKIAPANVYPVVKILMNKGIVESMFTKPVKFLAVQLINGLDTLIMQRKIFLSREIDSLGKIKENIATEWQNIRVEKEKVEEERFQILKGDSIYSKLLMSLDKISNNLYCYMSKKNFVKLYNTDFLDKLAKRIEKKGIQAVFLLDESLRNIDMERASIEVKFFEEAAVNDFLVFDVKEMFYYLDKPATSEENTILWTTLPSFVTIFKNMFEMERKKLDPK
jgi:sugar-specific transcriptional regulator TrmB